MQARNGRVVAWQQPKRSETANDTPRHHRCINFTCAVENDVHATSYAAHTMIRTHRPRGFAWTCASLFQQTPDFRNIDYESCLIDDQIDDFAPSERAAKRQRIEKLADDFLNGHALHITSARLPPQGIQNAVSRSFTKPKDARRAMAGIEVIKTGTAVWEDVQDQWEVMQAYNAASTVHDGDKHNVLVDAIECEEDEVIVEVHAQASCTSHRRQRTVRLALGPSEEALQQAAALRNRNLLRVAGPLPVPSIQRAKSEAVIEETQEDSSRSSLQSSVSDVGPTPTAAWTSSKWLKSGMIEARHKAVDEECSKDELGLSSLPTPSQKAAARPAVALRRGRSALTQQSTDVTSSGSNVAGDVTLSSSRNFDQGPNQTDTEPEQPAATAFVLVPSLEQSEQVMTTVTGEESQGDSQAQLLRRQGIQVAPRKLWVSFGGTAESTADSPAVPESAPVTESAVPSTIRATIQISAEQNAGKAPKGKRATKSTGAALASGPDTGLRRSHRRKSAPSESQAAANAMADLPVDQQRRMGSFRVADESAYTAAPGKDSSPFMFRKRVSRFNNNENPDIEPLTVETKQRQARTTTLKRPVNFPSDSPRPVQNVPMPTTTPADPKTPLVNEYLNRLLPNTGDSGMRSSSVRRALRDEMRLAGAELTRVQGDVPSSQSGPIASEVSVEDSPAGRINGESQPATEIAAEMPPPQIWPGTQILLAEAHKDLFNSPNKENTTLYLGDKTTPQPMRDPPRRQPLRTLSQEQLPAPSTQALLDGWQGWSSIKKPRSATGKRSSLAPSPSLDRGSSHASLVASDPVTSHSFDEVGLRRSSLRYSVSYNESTDPQRTESLPVAAFFPIQQSGLNKSTSTTSFESSNASGHLPAQGLGQGQDRPRRPSGGIASSAAFSQGQFLSTTEPNTITSLSLHAGLSSINQPDPQQEQQQQKSSLSFSPIARPKLPTDQPVNESATKTKSVADEPAHTSLSALLSQPVTWSFSPLAQQSNTERETQDKQPESAKSRTGYGSLDIVTPATAPFPRFQQAQDAAGSFLQNADMDSQELDFTVTDLVGDVLGSAKSDMPKGMGLFSQ